MQHEAQPERRSGCLSAALKEEFRIRIPGQLAADTGISPDRIAEIVNSRRRITADTAIVLLEKTKGFCLLSHG